MARNRTLVCAYCAQPFVAPIKSGPPPRYCTPAHRQRAYEQRRRATDAAGNQRTVDEVSELQSRIRRVELENRKLRQALDAAEAEAARLHRELTPPTSGLAYLAGVAPTAAPDPPEPGSRWRRGRRAT